MAKQQQFDFNKAARVNIIGALQYVPAGHRTSLRTVKMVLLAIENEIREKNVVWITQDQLAEFCSVNVSTVRRAVAWLEKANLLSVERVSKGHAGDRRTYNLYAILWSNCADWVNPQQTPPKPHPKKQTAKQRAKPSVAIQYTPVKTSFSDVDRVLTVLSRVFPVPTLSSKDKSILSDIVDDVRGGIVPPDMVHTALDALSRASAEVRYPVSYFDQVLTRIVDEEYCK